MLLRRTKVVDVVLREIAQGLARSLGNSELIGHITVWSQEYFDAGKGLISAMADGTPDAVSLGIQGPRRWPESFKTEVSVT
jgi:hypothetical protein